MSIYSGSPQVGIGMPVVDNDVSALNNPGQTIYGNDGSLYVYALAGGSNLVAGQLCQSAAETTTAQNLAVVAAPVGQTFVTTTTTVTVTANQFAGGYIIASVTPGLGYRYRILSHAAATGAVVTFLLEDPLQVAYTTATRIDVTANPFTGVVPAPTTATSGLVGFASNNITAGQYGWLQVRGYGSVTNDAAGAITVGAALMLSASVAGSVRLQTAGNRIVAQAATGIASGETGTAWITLF